MVTPRIPYPPNDGGAIRMFNILKSLSRNYELDLLTFDEGENEENLEKLRKYCNKTVRIKLPSSKLRNGTCFLKSLFLRWPYVYLRYSSGKMASALKRINDEEEYDFIFFNNLHTAQYCKHVKDTPAIADLHNNDSVIMKRWAERQSSYLMKKLGNIQARYIMKSLRKILSQIDLVITVSEKEKRQLQKFAPKTEFITANNGVDLEYFTPSQKPAEEPNLLFTGDMAWWPNTDASFFFLKEIFPQIRKESPDAKLILAGRRPPEDLCSQAGDHVEITGFVDDIRPYFHLAKVFVVPLRVGGGTRLKILEAMAMKIPVVSTSIGCEGLEVKDGDHLMIKDDPVKFSQAVIYLLNDDMLSEKLIKNSFKLVSTKYDWEIIMRDLINKLEG